MVDTLDPLGRGRLKVRVPRVHGFDNSISKLKDAELPWIDTLSSLETQVRINEMVWVMFDGYQPLDAFVMGTVDSGGRKDVQMEFDVIDGGTSE